MGLITAIRCERRGGGEGSKKVDFSPYPPSAPTSFFFEWIWEQDLNGHMVNNHYFHINLRLMTLVQIGVFVISSMDIDY